MDGNDSAPSLLGNKFTTARSGWSADAADLIVLFCSFLLTTASIVLVALVFYAQATFGLHPVPSETLSILQRGISALSITITSAMIMVAGKRYVLFKLARGGIHSQRVAVYNRPSIGNLAYYLVWHGLELPLLALSAVWALGLATGLTANDMWAMVPVTESLFVSIPFGPFDASVAAGSLSVPASEQLNYVMASMCSGVAGIVGLINVTGGPMGPLFYPPLPDFIPNTDFSLSTSLNGFNVSMEPLSSVPPTAQNLTCVDNTEADMNGTGYSFSTGQLWYEGSDDQTLSIIAALQGPQPFYRINASAIILGGTLRSTGDTTEFVLNGTTWPNVMSNDQWAQDVVSLVCNATFPAAGNCIRRGSLLDFVAVLNPDVGIDSDPSTVAGTYWGTMLGMAMGAYSAASWPTIGTLVPDVPVTVNGALQFTPRYGVYVLIANIVASGVMLVVVVKLRLASRLGGGFHGCYPAVARSAEEPGVVRCVFGGYCGRARGSVHGG